MKGAKVLSHEEWWGSGYCGICGDKPIPRMVQWWDPDDGWKVGVLCGYCFADAEDRPPKEGDYAYEKAKEQEPRDLPIDDLDGFYSDWEDV